MTEIEVQLVNGIPFYEGQACYLNADGVPISHEDWGAMTDGPLENKILFRYVGVKYIVSTIWIGLNVTGQVFQTATILERDDITEHRAWSQTKDQATQTHAEWEAIMKDRYGE